MLDNKSPKIYVAGHTGLAGSAIVRELKKRNYNNLLLKTHDELDLTDSARVETFFAAEKPDIVINAAAKAGGIIANVTYPVSFLLENIKIQNNIIENSFKQNVKKMIFLATSFVYPKNVPQPITEECLLTGALEETNEAYALAKICGLKLCSYYNREYNTDYISLLPCNLYGIGDNYHPQNSHVVAGLIRRFHEAKINNLPEVVVWGSGMPVREFLLSDDLARIVVFLLENKSVKDTGDFLNAGSGCCFSIAEMAEKVKNAVGYKGKIIFDRSKPDGAPVKQLDISKLKSLFDFTPVSPGEGLKIAYADFLKRFS